ncbi:hypothetical protein Hamer_G012228 [Homarus americanus]|uniref:Uncharacterized protein n=1 Tax=Homarus americanus TaxID=6706 RepID=A0A8J5KAL2_HOMAM|nr:hypothetical protein Hamer_G012228 [Homarus americanus]
MAGQEEGIIEEILNSNSSANEEEIVHIIQDEEEAVVSGSEELYHENKELVFWVPALLMVSREQQKITVTQDELRRRVAPPECLRSIQKPRLRMGE